MTEALVLGDGPLGCLSISFVSLHIDHTAYLSLWPSLQKCELG